MIEKPVQKSPPVSLSPSWAHQALGKRTAPILQSSFLEMLVRFSKQFSSSHIQPPNTPMLGRYDSHNTFGPQRDLVTYPRSWGVFNKSRNPAQVSSLYSLIPLTCWRHSFPHPISPLVLFSEDADAHTENRTSLPLPKALPFIAEHRESQENMAMTHSGLAPDVPPIMAARFSKLIQNAQWNLNFR